MINIYEHHKQLRRCPDSRLPSRSLASYQPVVKRLLVALALQDIWI